MEFTVALVGSAGVGKTTLIKRLTTGEFDPVYVATENVTHCKLEFMTTKGKIIFNVLDTPGANGNLALQPMNTDAIIGMFDLTCELSTTSSSGLITRLGIQRWNTNKFVEIPTVICGNKCDIKSFKYSITDKKNIVRGGAYFDISAKSNLNFEKPFLYLARVLTDDCDLEFIPGPGVEPPLVEIPVSMTPLEKAKANLKAAFGVYIDEVTKGLTEL